MSSNVPVLKYGSQKILDFRVSKENTKRKFKKDAIKIDFDVQSRIKKRRAVNSQRLEVEQKKTLRKLTTRHYIQLPKLRQQLRTCSQIQKYRQQVIEQMLNQQKKQQEKNAYRNNYCVKIKQQLNFIIHIHSELQLKQQTLYLSIIYFKQFSFKNQLSDQQAQVAAVACLFIASKYQEVKPPYSKHFLKFVFGLTFKQLCQMQTRILQKFQFNLFRITVLDFLQTLCEEKTKIYCLSNYLLQLYEYSQSITKFPSSLLAISAYKAAAFACKIPSKYTMLEQKCNFSKEEMDRCGIQMRGLLKGKITIKSIGLRKKFGSESMLKVSKMKTEIK